MAENVLEVIKINELYIGQTCLNLIILEHPLMAFDTLITIKTFYVLYIPSKKLERVRIIYLFKKYK